MVQYVRTIWDPISGPKMLKSIGCLESGNDEGRDQCCHLEVARSCLEIILRSKQVYKVMGQLS
jgi:hypothetical protein